MPQPTSHGREPASHPPTSAQWPAATSDLPLFLTPQRLAELLGVSVRTLERNRHVARSIPFRKIGRRVLYARDDVLAYLAEATFRSTAEAKAAHP